MYRLSLELSGHKLGCIDKLRGLLAVTLAYFIIHSMPLLKIGKLIKTAKHICIRDINVEEANVMWEAVRQSSFFFPARVACLEMSLAFVLFALTKRLSVAWCIGVKIEPFEAHAWVELNNKPFHESETVEQEFKKLFIT
jgi:hypothetical protein